MKWCNLKLTDNDGRELFKGQINELPLSEKNIISLSKSYFNDEQPCFIHRSAILSRIYNELNDYFIQNLPAYTDAAIPANHLPMKIKGYLDSFGAVNLQIS